MWRLLVVLALVACKDRPRQADARRPIDAAPIDAAVIAADPCEARAKRFSDRLDALAHEKPGSLPIVLPAVTLPAATDAKIVDEPGVVMIVTADGKVVIGDRTTTVAKAATVLEELAQRGREAVAMRHGPSPPWPLYLWADRSAKVGPLAKLLANEFAWKPRLLVEGEPAAGDPALLAKPSVKAVADAMPATAEEAKAFRAQHLRDAMQTCPAISIALARVVGSSGPVNELVVMAQTIPEAIAGCRCRLDDIDVVEYAMLSIFGAFHPTPKWIELPEAKPNDRRTIEALVAGR